MLAWTIYLSFAGAATLALWPKARESHSKWVALLFALGTLVIAVCGFAQSPAGLLQTIVSVPWIPSLGIRFELAADGISLTLVLLTGIATVAGVLFSWNVEHRPREFFALIFALIGGVYGVFLSFDLFLLFVFYEIAIVPKYFLIALWGSTRKEYGAMKLALYSFAGSAMVLGGILAAYVVSGGSSLSLTRLAEFPFPQSFQWWAFPLVFVGFGVLAGLWPLHTWAPTGHVAAPTAASMLLAGVIMKLGAYGCLRVAMALFPLGLAPWPFHVAGFGSWRDVFGLLAAIGILYGALAALVQKDFKFVVGYSSVSHMGFVLLGLVSLSTVGLSGAVLQMFSHGIIAGLLFAVVGRMVYDRTHTRDFDLLAPLELNRALPWASVIFVLAGLASMGMPGFSGFVAELQVLLGAWRAFPGLALLAGAGVLVGVAYTLRAVQRGFFSGQSSSSLPGGSAPGSAHSTASEGGASSENGGIALEFISLPEKIGAVFLLGVSLLIGLYPRLLLDVIIPSLDSSLFERLRKVGPG